MNKWIIKQTIKNILNKFNLLQRPWWTPPSSSLIVDLHSDFSGSYTEIYPGCVNTLLAPNVLGAPNFTFMAAPIDSFASIGVYQLDNATVCCSFGVVMDANCKIITQTSWNRVSPADIRLPFPPEKLTQHNLIGVTASIATESSDGNYGHFLLDSVGRLAILKKFSPNFANEIDHFIVSGPQKSWKIRLLSNFGVPSEKIVWIDDNSKYRCDILLVTSFPGAKRTYPAWLSDFFRQSNAGKNSLDAPPSHQTKRRLFFVRKGTGRQLKNEQALFELAKRYNFERYVPEESEDSLYDFRQAEAVIAPHGAGLADIAFMEPGSKVIELMPSDHRHCYFFTLAKAASLEYTVIVGKSDGERGNDAWGPSPFDFSINEEHLNIILKSYFPIVKE